MRNGRIAAAACIFPVSQRETLDRSLGLRHRAGLGITEESDAIAVVVSEETGGFRFVIGAGLSAISLRKLSANGSANFCSTALMKKLILNNWRAKLISLLLATTLWYLIKKNVATTPSPSDLPPRRARRQRASEAAALNAKSARDFLLPSDARDDNAGNSRSRR
jgi:hypothetical protein